MNPFGWDGKMHKQNMVGRRHGRALKAVGWLLAAHLALALGADDSQANSLARASTTSLGGSMTMLEGSFTILKGGSEILRGGSELIIESVKVVGDVTWIVLKGVGSVGRVVLTGVGETLKASVLATGQSIAVFSTAAGYVLYQDGQILAHVPNEVGRDLIFSEIHEAGR